MWNLKVGSVGALAMVMVCSVTAKPPAPPPTTPGISFNVSFGSYMVLQQAPAQACVYGMLGPGGTAASIKVSESRSDGEVAPFEVRAEIMDMDGGWKACLKPMQMGGDITITATCTGCTNATTAVIEHVTFGDVWYCGGQSNMALSLKHTLTRNNTRDAILSGKYTNIRIHGMEGNMNPFQPWATLKQALQTTPTLPTMPLEEKWDVQQGCTTADDPDCSEFMGFSAACYYFGESLSDELAEKGTAPPIGLIHTGWGGSSIEQWLTSESVAACEYTQSDPSTQEWHDQRVMPYIGMAIKGWTWYQGENDMHSIKGNSASNAGYSCLMKSLVEQWRSLWSATPNTTDPSAPFGIVTLASSGGEGANGLAMGSMRIAQTAGFGVLPSDGFPNTFLAQAYDLDDEWVGANSGGPCMDHGYNASDASYHCCGAEANATLCISPWNSKCVNMCASLTGTQQYMGGLHPRSKRPVGKRLATAAFNTVYGGTRAYTGPTLGGCTLDKTTLTIEFDKTHLRGETVLLQKYAAPNFTPYYHGMGNPSFHSGSQLYVQTVASSFCTEVIATNLTNSSSPVFCPTWAGGVGNSSTRPAPVGRFPTFGGAGATTQNDPNQFNMGWINLPITAGPTATSITVDLGPLEGATPTAVRYAWGIVDCCDLTDPNIYAEYGCIANCPIMGSSGLPANPFIAQITDNKCKCVAPQVCEM